MANEIKNRIIEILDNTFKVLDNCYKNNDEASGKANYEKANSRIIFPRYSTGERRISEQELRFVFIEQFIQYCEANNWDAYYSVETPTKWKYRFSGEEKPHKTDGSDGQSAMVDVCIHDNNGKRLCLIEFKAGNPDKFCYVKDLVKLYEEGKLGFFVQLLESQNSGTQKSIQSKIEVDIKDLNYVCHTLPSEKYSTSFMGQSIYQKKILIKKGGQELSS